MQRDKISAPKNILTRKRPLIRKKNPISKKPKFKLLKQSLEKVLRPLNAPNKKNSDIFESSSNSVPHNKKLSVNVVTKSLEKLPVTEENKVSQLEVTQGGFGKIPVVSGEKTEVSQFISERELKENRVEKEGQFIFYTNASSK